MCVMRRLFASASCSSCSALDLTLLSPLAPPSPLFFQTHHPHPNQTLHLTKYRHLTVELSSAAVLGLTRHDLAQADAFDAIPFRAYEP